MQAKISYRLTEAAQRAQIKATGQPVASKQTSTVEVQLEDVELFAVDSEGNLSLDLEKMYSDNPIIEALDAAGITTSSGSANSFSPDFIAGIRKGREELNRLKTEKLAEKAKEQADRQAKENQAVEAFFADPAARGARMSAVCYVYFSDQTQTQLSHSNGNGYSVEIHRADWFNALQLGSHPNRFSELWEEMERRDALDLAKEKAEKAVKEAAESAKEQAKLDFIQQWMQNSLSAPPELRAQYNDKLLSREDAIKAIAESTFGPYDLDKWTPNICDDGDCPCCRQDLDTLPPFLYPKYRELRDKLPKDAVLELEAVEECATDDYSRRALPAEYGVTVKLPAGPFVFKRLVKL